MSASETSSAAASTDQPAPATRAGVFRISGDLSVHRLGFGAMQITGTPRVEHLEENVGTALLALSDEEMLELAS
jgi:aryl-alcohol dehydrogenase-like predicted oxidoreductase